MAGETKPAEDKPKEVTKSKRQSREVEVVASDRIELVSEANDFVRNMVYKQIAPMIESTTREPTELLQEETRAYIAALGYLERQFKQGHRDAEVFDKRSENEESTR